MLLWIWIWTVETLANGRIRLPLILSPGQLAVFVFSRRSLFLAEWLACFRKLFGNHFGLFGVHRIYDLFITIVEYFCGHKLESVCFGLVDASHLPLVSVHKRFFLLFSFPLSQMGAVQKTIWILPIINQLENK